MSFYVLSSYFAPHASSSTPTRCTCTFTNGIFHIAHLLVRPTCMQSHTLTRTIFVAFVLFPFFIKYVLYIFTHTCTHPLVGTYNIDVSKGGKKRKKKDRKKKKKKRDQNALDLIYKPQSPFICAAFLCPFLYVCTFPLPHTCTHLLVV